MVDFAAQKIDHYVVRVEFEQLVQYHQRLLELLVTHKQQTQDQKRLPITAGFPDHLADVFLGLGKLRTLQEHLAVLRNHISVTLVDEQLGSVDAQIAEPELFILLDEIYKPLLFRVSQSSLDDPLYFRSVVLVRVYGVAEFLLNCLVPALLDLLLHRLLRTVEHYLKEL